MAPLTSSASLTVQKTGCSFLYIQKSLLRAANEDANEAVVVW